MVCGIDISSHTVAILWGAASRICSKQHAAYFCSFHLGFSPCFFFFETKWCIHPQVMTQLQVGRIPVLFLFFYWDQISTLFIHDHHIVSLAQISLTLSRHFSPSFIASGRSSGLHPVSSHSCCMYVLAGRPALTRPYVGVHWSTSLMSSSLLLQLCPACLVRLTRIVFEMGGRWPYSWCLVGCCCQDLFNIARNILM